MSATSYLGMEAEHIVAVDIEPGMFATCPTRFDPFQRSLIRVISCVQHYLSMATTETHKMGETPFCGVDLGTCEQDIKPEYIPIKADRSDHIEDFDVRC